MFRTLLATAVLLFASVVNADVESALDAVVKVKAGNATGTGTIFLVDKGHVHILTNAHVAATKDVNILFYRQGYESPPIPGQTAWRATGGKEPGTDNDLAVVTVETSRLGYTPPAMPIAPLSKNPKDGQTMITVGCPSGLWPQLFRGHIMKTASGRDSATTFYPPPKGGRSGSAVYDRECNQIIGVVAWVIGDPQGGQSVGGAVSLENIIRHMSGSARYSSVVEDLRDRPYTTGEAQKYYKEPAMGDGWKPVPGS
jgi:hypothetical protein